MTDKEKQIKETIEHNLGQAYKSGRIRNIRRFEKELEEFNKGKYKKYEKDNRMNW